MLQLNGKGERYNRTLLGKTRAFLYESEIEKKLWMEAMFLAYLQNIDLTKVYYCI